MRVRLGFGRCGGDVCGDGVGGFPNVMRKCSAGFVFWNREFQNVRVRMGLGVVAGINAVMD